MMNEKLETQRHEMKRSGFIRPCTENYDELMKMEMTMAETERILKMSVYV